MEKGTLVLLVLSVLVLVALVQAFQLSGLKTQVAGGSVAAPSQGEVSSQSSGGSQQAKLPSNLDNLPSMVGGC